MARHGMKHARPAGWFRAVSARSMVADHRADRLARRISMRCLPTANNAHLSHVLRTRLSLGAAQPLAGVGRPALRVVAQFRASARSFVDSAPVLGNRRRGLPGWSWRGKHTLLLNRDHRFVFLPWCSLTCRCQPTRRCQVSIAAIARRCMTASSKPERSLRIPARRATPFHRRSSMTARLQNSALIAQLKFAAAIAS